MADSTDAIREPFGIVPLRPAHTDAGVAIGRSLPAWFGIEAGLAAMRSELERGQGFAALRAGPVMGFVTLQVIFPETWEITWMAVVPDAHRRGIGSGLVEHAAGHCREAGGRLLLVRTLADLHPSPEYAGTRAFYRAAGFLRIAVLPEEWDAENPCLLLGRPL